MPVKDNQSGNGEKVWADIVSNETGLLAKETSSTL